MKKTGLTAYQIKLIALCAMTLDHLAACASEIPVISKYSYFLRIIGRIAAPLFLFALTESIYYTHNRTKFILRLYFAAVGVGLFTTVTNYFFWSSIGRFTLKSNILFTYFYIALYVTLIEQLKLTVKNKDVKGSIIYTLAMVSTILPNYISDFLNHEIFTTELAWDLTRSFIRGPLQVEYSILFVIMGVLMYYAPNKYLKAAILAISSIVCYYSDHSESFLQILLKISPDPYFANPQFWMILAVPFILLYNGERGKEHKRFFYVYYPIHRYLIAVIEFLYLTSQPK